MTLDIVTKNVNAYIGKRVRWFGELGGGTWTGGDNGQSYNIQAIYVDNRDKGAKDFQYFMVKYKSKESLLGQPERAWINGTVKGTDVVDARVTSPDGKESVIRKKVPLLVDPEFEEIEGENK